MQAAELLIALIAAAVVPPAFGYALWMWVSTTRIERALREFDGPKGLHFDAGPDGPALSQVRRGAAAGPIDRATAARRAGPGRAGHFVG